MSDTAWEVQAYGSPKTDILESITDSITFKLSYPESTCLSFQHIGSQPFFFPRRGCLWWSKYRVQSKHTRRLVSSFQDENHSLETWFSLPSIQVSPRKI